MTNAQRIVEALEAEVERLESVNVALFSGAVEARAEVERLRGVVQAAREVWRLYDGPANYPLIGELGVALAALEAGDG